MKSKRIINLVLFIILVLCSSCGGHVSNDNKKFDICSSSKIEKIELINDNNYDGFSSIQGICNDGENVYYYISGVNELKKYSLFEKKVIMNKKIDIGHCGDMCYNSKNKHIYCVSSNDSLVIYELSENLDVIRQIDCSKIFDNEIGGITYLEETDEYLVLAGEQYFYPYGPHEQIYICDNNFNIKANYNMKNDFGCDQSIASYSNYFFVCKSYPDKMQSILVFDFSFKEVCKFNVDAYELEGISFLSEDSFIMSECKNTYNGGFVNICYFK